MSDSDPLAGEDSAPIQDELMNKYKSAALRGGAASGATSALQSPSAGDAISPRPDDSDVDGDELDDDSRFETEESYGEGDPDEDPLDDEQTAEADADEVDGDVDDRSRGVSDSELDVDADAELTEEANQQEENEGEIDESGTAETEAADEDGADRASDYDESGEAESGAGTERREREMPAILNQFIQEGGDMEDQLAADDDDYQYHEAAEDSLDGLSADAVMADELMQAVDREDVRTLVDLQRAREERDHLIEVNKARQRAVAAILEREKQSKARSFQGGLGMSEGPPGEQARQEYMNLLDQLSSIWAELERKREEAEGKIDTLTARLDSSDEKCTELAQTFKQFKREIAKEARHSRTNHGIQLKRILAFEAEEERRDREIAEQRLKHIHLIQEIGEMERIMKEKEKLADGLHLIDFEQLKIENQTLNEKIEERNDELHKLRKKTTATVQVLTHIKEKLTFLRSENEDLWNQLNTIQGGVNEGREALTGAKKARDALRAENLILKQKQGFIGSDLLVSDFEARKGEILDRKRELKELKRQWDTHQEVIRKAQAVGRVVEEKNKMRELFPGSGTFVPIQSTIKRSVKAAPSSSGRSTGFPVPVNEGNFFATRGFQGFKKFSGTATIRAKK